MFANFVFLVYLVLFIIVYFFTMVVAMSLSMAIHNNIFKEI